ncbi:MAG: tetratricopeptide repeat protein [Magnetococcus sp. XQGC-1]
MPPPPEPDPLPPLATEHTGALLQLDRLLGGTPRFVLIFLEFGERRYRDAVIQRLAEMGHPGLELVMQTAWESSGPILEALATLPGDAPVHLLELGAWLRLEQGKQYCHLLNLMRDGLAKKAPRPLLLWLGPGELRTLALEAPDFWAWRGAVLTFTRPGPAPADNLLPRLSYTEMTNLDHDVARRRVATIDQYLATNPEPSWAVASLWQERGELRRQWGEWDEALQDLRMARTLFEQQGDPHTAADVTRSMAGLLWRRGEGEMALRLLEDEILPLLEKLGDIPSHATTMGDIAGILQAQGKLDEALRIYEAQLPIFEQQGDRLSCASTMSNIADIRAKQGNLNEALRILEKQTLIFEQFGDIRTHATTMVNMASILLAQDKLDEALRIYEEQIPIFEKIGDTRSRAVTMTNIANIRYKRGEVDAALRIYEEQIPLLEKLGDAQVLSMIQKNVAKIEQNSTPSPPAAHAEYAKAKDALASLARQKTKSQGSALDPPGG